VLGCALNSRPLYDVRTNVRNTYGGGVVLLGILLDDETPRDSVIRLALVAERAGLTGLWLARGPGQPATQDPSEPLAALAAAAECTSTIALGAYLARLPDGKIEPAGLAERLDAVLPASANPTGDRSNGYGWRGRITVRIEQPPERPFPPGADGVVIPIWAFGPNLPLPDLPVAVELAASIGRTMAEATARLDADHRLRGQRDPRRGGLFGTLEQCQARVAELARDGVAEVRCWLPDTPDVHDVIAQLSAVAVGALTPTEQGRHAQPPAPPPGWGGRRPRRDRGNQGP
jgi:hypothetical protein